MTSTLDLHSVQGLLIDIDGTVMFQGQLIPGASEAIDFLKQKGIPYQFITNNDSNLPDQLAEKMTTAGLPTGGNQITSAVSAGIDYVINGGGRAYSIMLPAVRCAFDRLGKPDDPIKYVVLGDPRESLSFETANQALKYLLEGAELVALQPAGKFITEIGLQIDTGAVAAMLEYASGKKATLMGKPQPLLFQSALRKLGMRPEQVAVIGDDITADIAGASALGMRSVLVRTGMYSLTWIKDCAKPTAEIASIADLPKLFQR